MFHKAIIIIALIGYVAPSERIKPDAFNVDTDHAYNSMILYNDREERMNYGKKHGDFYPYQPSDLQDGHINDNNEVFGNTYEKQKELLLKMIETAYSDDATKEQHESNPWYILQMLKNDAEKKKRAYHRELCHFKLCNLGEKRNPRRGLWYLWRRRN